jgi:large subunit ribosomal protein L28
MSMKCQLTGKGPMVGNNVSHAKNKTKRRFMPNLQKRRIWNPTEGRYITFKKISTRALRTIDKIGIEAFLERQAKED